jgi:4,5-dihydroxyphthalate decarboxylase
MTMYEGDQLRLSAMMGTYPKTDPLKKKILTSALFDLDIAPVDVAQKAFKALVRESKFDVSEVAIVTYLQAFAAGKPYVLLPFVMNGNFHHKSLICRSDAQIDPRNLSGRKIAMRAYTQTTPTWVRGILTDEYGMRLDSVQWLSQEGAHVAGYTDPPWVQQLDSSLSLEQMLIAGEVDAIMAGGGVSDDPRIRPLIPNPREAALAWYAQHKIVPINHMITVRTELAQERPDVVRELYRLLRESRNAGEKKPTHSDGIDLQPFGFEAVTPAVEMVTRFAAQQRLIPEQYPIEKLFGPVLEALTR